MNGEQRRAPTRTRWRMRRKISKPPEYLTNGNGAGALRPITRIHESPRSRRSNSPIPLDVVRARGARPCLPALYSRHQKTVNIQLSRIAAIDDAFLMDTGKENRRPSHSLRRWTLLIVVLCAQL